MSESSFTGLPDLASHDIGGRTLQCNDDFFAEMDNLLRPHPAVWKEHEYTDRGKWMDGWETRRRRPGIAHGHPSHDGIPPPAEGAHDWCIVRLGMPGVIRGVVVDTAYFRGNFPESCAIYATTIDDALDIPALAIATWKEILPRAPLKGDSKNEFAIADRHRYTHVRLDIFPDGGVARLRVHGEVVPNWPRLRALGTAIDLAALEHGAVVETCSDMFFGSRNNLIKPGSPPNMSDGWETRRRRGPGNDWALVRLATAGTIERIELDTTHFRGNAPGRCTLEGVHAPGVAADQLLTQRWRPLLAAYLQPHTRHVFDGELRRIGAITHLKLSVFPDGGIARLRAWGQLGSRSDDKGLAALDAMTAEAARAALLRCCGSTKWADAMAAHRPFEDVPAMLRTAERIWWSLDEAAHREAFAAHPKIGTPKPPPGAEATAGWAGDEQKGTAAMMDLALATALASANAEYDAKHGFIFIVCATGRTADEMLADLRARLETTSAEELRTAAEEQLKITRLRCHKLMGELG